MRFRRSRTRERDRAASEHAKALAYLWYIDGSISRVAMRDHVDISASWWRLQWGLWQ